MLTSRILKHGEHFEVKIDEVVDCWTGSLQIGVMTHDPATLTFPSTMTDLTSGAWMLTSDGVHHDGKITGDEEIGEVLDELTVSVVSKSSKKFIFLSHRLCRAFKVQREYVSPLQVTHLPPVLLPLAQTPDRRDHRLLVTLLKDTGKCGVNEIA